MQRLIIIILFLIGFLIESSSQNDYQFRHVFGIDSEYFYLDISSDSTFNMKIGMYDDNYLSGNYIIDTDTLELISFEFQTGEFEISKPLRDKIIKSISRFQIDSIFLIPIAYSDYSYGSMTQDSTMASEYLLSDNHVYYSLTFYQDSSFYYRTGSDMGWKKTKGDYQIQGDIVKLQPKGSKRHLNRLCSDNYLILVQNYLIGKKYYDRINKVELRYMRGLKPAANKM